MTAVRSPRLAVDDDPRDDLEGEIRQMVRGDVAVLHRPEPAAGETHNVGSLIERVAGSSIEAIEKLIADLQNMRDFLQIEGERVQREVAAYTHMSQMAMNSAKGMAESMAHWKAGVVDARLDRR